MSYWYGYIEKRVNREIISVIIPYLIHIPILGYIIILFFNRVKKKSGSSFLLPALSLKLLCGVGLGAICIYHYNFQTDPERFHQNASVLADLFRDDPMGYFNFLFTDDSSLAPSLSFINEPRALLFVKLVSPIEILTLSNFWLTSIYLTLFSFIVSWKFFQRLCSFFPTHKISFAIALLFFPSVVFWSSGLIKETLMLPCIYFLIMMALDYRFSKSIRIWQLLLLLPVLYVLLNIKYYVFALLVPLIIVYVITEKWLAKSSGLKRLVVGFFLLVGLFLLASIVHPNLNPSNLVRAILVNHDLTVLASMEGSFVDFGITSQSDLVDLLPILPKATISGLFRPTLGDGSGFLNGLAIVENLFLMVIAIAGVYGTVKYRLAIKNEAVYIILYSVILATLLALASPNFGTLVRYKVMFLPLLLCVLIYPCQVFLQNTMIRKK